MKKSRFIFLAVVIGVLLFWVGTWIFIPIWYKETTFGAGTFGDMFGGINALFSGLAFVGLIYTILVQKDELARQDKATKDQAKDLKRQKELLQFQFVLAHVKELLIIKNNRISNLNFVDKDGTSYCGILAITQLVREKHASDTTYYAPLKQWMDSFFYILQYIDDSELEDKYKKLIIDFIFLEVSWSEVHVLYGMNQKEEQRIKMMDKFGLKNKVQ